jgi:hypothetical protein
VRRDAVAGAPGPAGAAGGRARSVTRYFVPLGLEVEPLPELEPLGVELEPVPELEPLGVELEPLPELELPEVLSLGVVVDGGVVVDDGGVVDGEADGVRSPGRSPSRSLRDSEHAVMRPALSASAHRPVSSFFIWVPPSCGCDPRIHGARLQRACPPP